MLLLSVMIRGMRFRAHCKQPCVYWHWKNSSYYYAIIVSCLEIMTYILLVYFSHSHDCVLLQHVVDLNM